MSWAHEAFKLAGIEPEEALDTLTAAETKKLLRLIGRELDLRDADKRTAGAALVLEAAARSLLALTTDRAFRAAWERYCAAHPELRARSEMLRLAADTFSEAFEQATGGRS